MCNCGQEVKPPSRYLRGHNSRVDHPRGNTKLTEENVVKIKKILATRPKTGGRPSAHNYVSDKSLGRRFGVSMAAIHKIDTGEAWTHVPWS